MVRFLTMMAPAAILLLALLSAVSLPSAADAGVKSRKGASATRATNKTEPGIESMARRDVSVAYRIGRIHETGDGTPVNGMEAARFYEMAVAKGHAHSRARLGYLLATGKAGRIDGERAKILLSGSLDGLTKYEVFEIAKAFDEGHGVPADTPFALHLYLQTPAWDVEDAEVRAASILISGKGGAEKDLALAEDILHRYSIRYAHSERVRMETEPLLQAIRNAGTGTAKVSSPTENSSAIR